MMPSPSLLSVAAALLIMAVSAAATATANATTSDELVFGVFTPACFDAFFTQHDFANVACLKLVVSKAIGYAIIAASLVLKLPQILKVVRARDVTGLMPASFYMEVLLYASSTAYNVLKGYPLSTWGENVIILAQNVVLVLLLWTYATPVIAYRTRLAVVAAFAVIMTGVVVTPPEHQWLLASAAIPVSIAARIPQIVSNFKQGHTGQLAFVTLVLNFGGSVARIFTTLQETGDPVQLVGYGVGMVLNGTLVLQVLLFWGATTKALAVAAKKKTK